MKKLIPLLWVIAASSPFASTALASKTAEMDYNVEIRFVLQQLRQEHDKDGMPSVSGRSVSYGGKHGAFFFLFPFIADYATPEDVARMVDDGSPVIRVVAAKCILNATVPLLKREMLVPLRGDKESVRIGPLIPTGEFKVMSVAEVVAAMENDPEFLMCDYDVESPKR